MAERSRCALGTAIFLWGTRILGASIQVSVNGGHYRIGQLSAMCNSAVGQALGSAVASDCGRIILASTALGVVTGLAFFASLTFVLMLIVTFYQSEARGRGLRHAE